MNWQKHIVCENTYSWKTCTTEKHVPLENTYPEKTRTLGKTYIKKLKILHISDLFTQV